MATLTINHYINEANSFITDIRDNRNGYYLFAARPQPWANSSGGNDDSAVLATNSSIAQVEQTVYDDILFGKLLADADVSFVVPRKNWTANTIYAAYNQNDANLYSKDFYVVTDNFEVYKCIDNNNGANSTVKPSLTSTSGVFKSGDGYIWKYMYTVDPASNTKFTTTSYIPVVPNTAVQSNATPGSIDVIKITNGGEGYEVYESGYIGGVVNKFIIQLPDTSSNIDDYYTTSSIYLKSGFGAGQIREISSSNGVSKQIIVNEPFETYARLDLANIQGTVATGYFVEQPFDDINYLYTQGYFNSNSTIAQSDTGTAGRVLAANTSVLQIARNISNSAFTLGLPVVDTSFSGTLEPGTVSVGNVGACNIAFVTSAGSGYTANATVTITANGSGSGAAANAQANATGKIAAINITSVGSAYFVAPTLAVSAPTAQTFNANTAVTGGSGAGSNNVIALATAGSFVANDLITYTVSAGNTAIGGLTSGTSYFIEFANSTVVALKASLSGSRILITKGPTEDGHTLQGQTATAVMFCDNQIVRGSGTQLNDSANGYANGEYIRIGANTTSNIRRVANNVNTTVLIVQQPFGATFTASANLHYKMPVAAEPVSIVVQGANGYVSNTNLTSVQVAITNSAISGRLFTVGERVNMTNSAKINQGANAVIAYSNTSTVILSSAVGTWQANSGGTQFFVSGESSQQLSQITLVTSNPNITLNEPAGTFKLGYPVTFRTIAGGAASGNATLVAKFDLPNDQTEYQIGPTIHIEGDGANAVAFAVVNTAANSSYEIVGIDVINPGIGYTQANVFILANTSYGSNALATPVISPVFGHGYDPVTELGARYVGINSVFDDLSNENYKFLGYGQYRKVGILENPQFRDIKVTLTDFDRANFTLNAASYSSSSSWTPGEVVVQASTNAAGVVVFGNTSFLQLKNVKKTFNVSNTIYGFFSNTTANVNAVEINRFPVGNSAAVVTQANSGAVGVITAVGNNTVYFMSNVVGQFADGDIMYDTVANAYATVESIFTSNGTVDVSADFGNKFNQTARIALTAVTGTYIENEYVEQEITNASGRVVSFTDEKDLIVSSMSGSFAVGQTVTDTTTNANGICTFANSTYIRMTNVSQDTSFVNAHSINNGLGSTASIVNVLPVLVLNDVSDNINFQATANAIVGMFSGAAGYSNNYLYIKNPDLVRDTGKVIYSESFTPVTRSATSKEEIKLVIKF